MSQFIYISKFPASPEATKLQQMHFEADANFAYSEEYSFIKSSDNLTFQIVSPTELVEVDVTEEQLQAVEENLQALSKEAESSDDYCIQCHNLMLIDQIINNTLLQEGKLSAESCYNMLTLAQLKSILGGC